MQDCHSCDPGSIPGVGATSFVFHTDKCLALLVGGNSGQKIPHRRQHQKNVEVLAQLNFKR